MADVFVSYSHQDQNSATRLADGLEREGFRIWRDVAIQPGEVFDKVTERALDESRVVLVLWSKASVDSVWVRSEATSAQRGGKLLPVMIEACERPIQFELVRTMDLSGWRGNPEDPDWRALVASIRARLNQDVAPDGGTTAAGHMPAASPRKRGRLTAGLLLGALLLALAIGASIWLRDDSTQPRASDPLTAARVPLAVLPFVNLSPDPDQEYFSDGLSEEILNQLAQIRGLRVIGRMSSFSFKGRNEDLRDIARKLGVERLLQGSIRKDGDSIRISAQLIDGADGGTLFSRTYDRKLSQIFTIQEEVAGDVARALSVALDVGEMSRIEGGTTDLEAFDRYQRARDAFLRRGGPEGFRIAEQQLRDAVAIDPQFTRAWLQLAWLVQSPRAPQRPASETDALLSEASARVTALAPDRWEAKVIRTYELVRQRNWVAADALATATYLEAPLTAASLEKASIYGQIHTLTGRLAATIDMYEEALRLEPASLVISGDQQYNLTNAGRLADADAEYLRSMDFPGDHTLMHFMALLRTLGGDDAGPEIVREVMGRIWGEEATWSETTRALMAAAGDREASRTVVRQSFDNRQMPPSTAYRLADALGDSELSVTALEQLMRVPNPPYGLIWAAPFSDVRAQPRFKAILEQLGIADFFRATGQWGDFCRPVGSGDFECHGLAGRG